MSTHQILLIDADVVAYSAAQAVEVAVEWLPGFWTWHVDVDAAIDRADRLIDRAREALDIDDYKLALTDIEHNWRKDILPTYKENRKGGKKPLSLLAIREYLIDQHGAMLLPYLEGDDILGLWATGKHQGQTVLWSIDKDLKTIPGRYLRDLDSDIIEISEEEANYWHLFQTLTGDTTDGYSGCPGIGPKRAAALLPEDQRIETPDIPAIWKDVIVPTYRKAKSSEEEALVQARVARILRQGEYIRHKGVRLWTPPSS